MPAAGILRHNAVTGLRRMASAEPLLPFLYNTRTIRTQHTDALSDLESQPTSRPRTPRRQESGRPREYAQRNQGGRGGYGGRRQDSGTRFRKTQSTNRVTEFKKLDLTSDPDSLPERSQYQRRPREEHIPFEHAAQETSSIREQFASSTMTPGEKKAFEGLLSLQRKSVDENDELDKALARAKQERDRRTRSEAAQMPEVLLEMQENMKADKGAAHQALLDQAMEQDLERVRDALQSAGTDVALWEVFHDKVLARLSSLDLDGPLSTLPYKRKGKPAPGNGPVDEGTPKWPGDVPDEEVIARTLPQHAVECIKLLRYEFGSSQLGTSLLPYLKQMGPAVYALAASTKLYNHHLAAVYHNTMDLQQVVSTLDEMDKEVYDFDDKTHDLLDSILRKARIARQGTYGPGVQAIWFGERLRFRTSRIIHWNKRIVRRMEEKALREARAVEEEASPQADGF